ncbi:restriction endonuclease subunit S [Cryomorpha ignava]|uniref:Restriction endonuclease subunit S n=1 Tax=Cryomorpha ignava TaxID=101383 RepID=A0A7K3WS36_9FLAO|nr:restriction endonuclease subunit S [Cryomorpha ignava]NEN24490.1 restriction endonuclease subunit S [Cryomorpha ignava]
MKTELKNIANIQTGVFAKAVAKGDMVYLQPKYYDEDGNRVTEVVPDLNSIGISANHHLQPGDILFSSKGTKNFATCFDDEDMNAAASTSFFVVRLQDRNVLPEFLTWHLNQPTTMSYLKAFAKGSSIPSISKEVLGKTEITVPSIQKQQLICKIAKLTTYEKQIHSKLMELRNEFYQQKLYTALNN